VSPLFYFDNDHDSDSDSYWSDLEPEHIDPSEAINILTPPSFPTGSDFDPRDEEPAVLDTPPAFPTPRPPPVTPTSRPVRSSAKVYPYFFGLASAIDTLKSLDTALLTAAAGLSALAPPPPTKQIGTHLPTPTPHSATALPTIAEHLSYKKALASPQASQCQAAMAAAVQSLTTLNVFESLPLPPFQRAIPVKWVFKLKQGDKGEILRYKARLVVCGFMQKNCVDVDETYAPVFKHASLRFMLAHCCAGRIDITHLGIKTAFLNAPLEEVMWCDPPQVFAPPWPKVAPQQSPLWS
jgi:hypothetical protein